MYFLYLIFSIILLSPGILSYSQSEPVSDLKNALIIERLTYPVDFDGVPDEETWNSITPLKMVMYSPFFGKNSSEITDTRIAYDDKYLYVASRLFYNDPGMLKSTSLKRDYLGMGGERFGIILDTYNDKENALGFFTSPDAQRLDGTIKNDAADAKDSDQLPMNISFNTFWDVLTKINESGWSIEMRIPFSSLRFQTLDEKVRMGLIVQRWIPLKNEIDLFPAIPPNWGNVSPFKPSQAQEIVLKGVKPSKPVYISPYLLTRYENTFTLNSQETSYERSDKPALEVGLDVKYGITKNMIMDLTVNTDFAQVEADDQQINLTRYSLYFPEKRMFFLERASVFDFTFGGSDNLFYSRRIGISEDGDPVRILGGARITGKIGKWDMGILNMQTASLWKEDSTGEHEEILPSENFGVIRFRRQVLNENSYIGAMTTSRLGVNGSYNLAYGIDGIIRLFGDDYLDLRWSQTIEDDIKEVPFKESTRIMANWARRSSKGLGYNMRYSMSGIHYNPGIGYEKINDYTSVSCKVNYGWLPGEGALLYSHTPDIGMSYRTYIDDGSLMSSSYNIGWSFLTKSQWQGGLNLVQNIDNLRDSLILKEDEIFVTPGKYEYVNYNVSLVTPTAKSFFLALSYEAGQYFDGTGISINLQPTWNISKHLELGCIYNFDSMKIRARGQRMANHIIGVKSLYMLDTRLSISTYIQYNTGVNGVITNFRLRYNPKEGNDLYLVFNEARNFQLTREIPKLPVYSLRSLLLKYTYTFSFEKHISRFQLLIHTKDADYC